MAPRMIGPFEVGDRLGVGGMGIVYRAKYTKTGAPVAIKILSPDLSDSEQLQKRFEREIAILKKLQHPHIVRYYGGGKIGTQRFYAMELVTGGALEEYLKGQGGKLPWEQAINFARQTAEALEHAHNAGVIHRDLKPANLLLSPDKKTLKLTDFGIARDTTATALTAAGRTVGTYAYMAPEQIRGKPPVDRRTDLYALGCVLYELLTGQTPFQAETHGEMLMMHLQDDPPRIVKLVPEVPQIVEDLVFEMLQKEPDDRPFDALSVQVKLDEAVAKITQQREQALKTAGGGELGATILMGSGQAADVLKKAKKKKKKREQVPFYETYWFLGMCLVLLLSGITWSLLPLSEDQLMAKARPLMNLDDPSKAREARDRYLLPLLARFKDGKHATEARDFVESVEMHDTETQARKRAALNKEPIHEAERLYLRADRFEKIGDRITALETYEGMVRLLKDEKYRAYVNLAKRQIRKIEAAGGETDREAILTRSLDQADFLFETGKTVDARNIWNSIIDLYGDNQELEPLVQRARARLAGRRAQLAPDADPPERKPARKPAAASNPPPRNSNEATDSDSPEPESAEDDSADSNSEKSAAPTATTNKPRGRTPAPVPAVSDPPADDANDPEFPGDSPQETMTAPTATDEPAEPDEPAEATPPPTPSNSGSKKKKPLRR